MLAAILAAEEPRIHIPHADELIWGSIAFLILFVFLAKLVFPKAKETLAQRTEKIQGQMEAAEKVKLEADKVLDEYRRQLADARNESQRIIDEAKNTAESLRREIQARAQAEAQDIVNRARAEVAGERDRAMQALRSTIGDLSITLATKVVEKELASPEAQRALVQRMIDELAASGNGQR